jgi:protein-S-isoprenylcysteine O-methyltransferase Ste14
VITATIQSQYRGFVQGKTRIVLAWIFAALLVVSAHALPSWPGILLCFIGATLRYWASGYLRKDSKPAVGGPYAWVRNPLYLGTYLMAVGTAAATGSYWLFAALTVVFWAIYHFIILDEEAKLERVFGQAYVEYCAHVPRFFPYRLPDRKALLRVNPEEEHRSFNRELAAKNKAYEAYLSFAGLIGFVAAVAYLKKTLS